MQNPTTTTTASAQPENVRKEKLFKTARCQFDFAGFKQGEIVSVKYYNSSMDGTTHWYWINNSDVTYNDHAHLADFVL